MDTKTAQVFVSILTDTLVAFRVEAWTWSVRKRLRHSPKIYFFDCGVLNAIRGELGSALRPSTFAYGKIFETYVVQELIRMNDYTNGDYRFFYWRTNIGTEVDLVLSRGPSDPPVAIEIKSSSAPASRDIVGLKAFAIENPRSRLVCLCQTPRFYRREGVEFYPWKEGLATLFPVRR